MLNELIKVLRFFLVMWMLVVHTGKAQFISNEKEQLSKNGIKNLLVSTDSLSMGCPIQYEEYDSAGNTVHFQKSIMDDRHHYAYDSKGHLVRHTYYVSSDASRADTISKTDYFYSASGKFRLGRTFNFADSTFEIIRHEPKEKKVKLNRAAYAGEKLMAHRVTSFYRNCLGEFPGNYKLVYDYFPNGLVRSVEFIPLSAQGRKAKWFFLYNRE